MKFPFVQRPVYTAITLGYKNQNFIADRVLPRLPVGGRLFIYQSFNRMEMFTLPETLVGRKGRPNEVEFTGVEATGGVLDYGLDDIVPSEDIASAPPGYDPLGRATEGLTELILLDREVRVAATVFAAGTYAAANKVTVASGDQWHKTTGDVVGQVLDTLTTMMVRPNTLIISRPVWSKMRRNPSIIAALIPQGSNALIGGKAGMAAVAELLEIDEILIGEAWVNSQKPGQAGALVPVWGNQAAFIYKSASAGPRKDLTFGFTATWESRVSGTMDEPKIGLRGSTRVRVGESVKEIIVSADTGFLFNAPIG